MPRTARVKLLYISTPAAAKPDYKTASCFERLKQVAVEVSNYEIDLAFAPAETLDEPALAARFKEFQPEVCVLEGLPLASADETAIVRFAELAHGVPVLALFEDSSESIPEETWVRLARLNRVQIVFTSELSAFRFTPVLAMACAQACEAHAVTGPSGDLSLLQPALDAMQAAIAVLGSDATVLYANRKWLTEREAAPFIGCAARVGANFDRLCRDTKRDFAELASAAAKAVRDVAEGRIESFYVEYSINTVERRWYSIRITRMLDGGLSGRTVVAHLDITRRKANETELTQSEQVFREIAEIVAQSDRGLDERIGLLLKSVCLRFDYDYGFFCQFTGNQAHVRHAAADTDAERINTSAAIAGDVLEQFTDSAEPRGFGSLSEYGEAGMICALAPGAESCHGVSVHVEGEVHGCVLFTSSIERAVFSDSEKLVLRLLSRWIGQSLETARSVAVQHRQRQILERIAAGDRVSETLRLLTDLVEAGRDDKAAAVFLLSADGRTLNIAVSERLSVEALGAFETGEIGLGFGSSAAAAFLGELVTVSDLSTNPLWANRRAQALEQGIKSAVSQPIFSSEGKVLGVCSIYYSTVHQPSDAEIKHMQEAAYLAGIAIESSVAETEIRRSEEELRLVTDSLPVLISYVDRDERYQFNNKAYEDWFGMPRDHLVGRHIEEIIGERAYKIVAGYVKRALSGEKVLYERTVLRADGSMRQAENQLIPHITEDGVQGFFTLVNDVTDKRRQEEALRASEARLQTLVESLPFDLWFCDVGGRLVLQNSLSKQRWGDRLGLEPSQIDADCAVLRCWDELYHTASAGEIAQREISGSYRGEERTYRTIVAPVIDGAQMLGVCGVNVDITDRKRAEEALRKSEQRYRLIAENAYVGFWHLGADGYTLYANPAMCEMLEVSGPEELEGQVFHSFFPDESLKTIAAHYSKRLIGQSSVYEAEIVGKRGTLRNVVVAGVPYFSSEGKLESLLGTYTDITQRKRAEEALKGSEAQLKLILEQIPALLWTTDRELRITYGVGSRAGGLTQRDTPAVGQMLHEFFQTEDPAALPLDMHRRALEGESVNFEFRRRGKIYEVEIEPLVSEDGQTLGCIAVGLDVTERRMELQRKRELEAQLQDSHKLESLGLLAGGIAHDFNNLLMGVLGNAGLALLDVPPNSAAAGRIKDIETTARHAADLTNQLLAYAGRGRFVVEPVDLSLVGREMGALLKTAISKRAELRYDLETELPPIDGDATQIRQVIMNLITNASDALGSKPGIITVRTGLLALADPAQLTDLYGEASLPAGSYVFLEVADTGSGMSPETMRRIFDPFFSTKFAGRGLGLSAVLGIVRGHGGAIRVHSEPGEGTVFQVLLPASKNPRLERRAEPSQAASTTGGSGTILVVDDEETVREVAASMLVQVGYQVLTAEDGDSAVEIFAQHKDRISAIVLDLTMPRLGGEQAFAELRKVNPTVPILLSSGYHAEDTTALLADQQAVGFLQKPYGPQALIQSLQKLISGSREGVPERAENPEKLPV